MALPPSSSFCSSSCRSSDSTVFSYKCGLQLRTCAQIPYRTWEWRLRASDLSRFREVNILHEKKGVLSVKGVIGKNIEQNLASGGENCEQNCKQNLENGSEGSDFYNKFPPKGGGGGGGDGGKDDSEGGDHGILLKFDEVIKELESRGSSLPSDMLEVAKNNELSKDLLEKYFSLENAVWPLGMAVKYCSWLRNRMLADPAFLFKVGTEIVIDSCCATFAEVQKRGKDFWKEFELFCADLLVGVVVNVALVGMLAPYQRIGRHSQPKNILGSMVRAYGSLPSSVFEAERPGCKFSMQQRIGAYFFTGVMYSVVGFACGIVGQGIANTIMMAKRNGRNLEEDVPVPPLVKSAALWGAFLAVSSNTRYQAVNGLERLVEASPAAMTSPAIARAFTFGLRTANNIYGGMQFVDWARLTGVQ